MGLERGWQIAIWSCRVNRDSIDKLLDTLGYSIYGEKRSKEEAGGRATFSGKKFWLNLEGEEGKRVVKGD